MRAYTSDAVKKGALSDIFHELYGPENIKEQTCRYTELIGNFQRIFGPGEALLFSSPGRSEICGNHTDHNRGLVIAAGIHLDKIAAVVPRSDSMVEIITGGFAGDINTSLRDLQPDTAESGQADALVRGIAAYFQARGYSIGGFSAYIDSRVAMGSGLSSSASLEVLIGMIFNTLYNSGKIGFVELAKAGKFAENTYFHKPCGLMDQIACAAGGTEIIDFEDEEEPVIERLDFDLRRSGYQLMILDTGGHHANLTGQYAAIPGEMGCVARQLGHTVLRECSLSDLLNNSADVRSACGDRAVLRGIHFFQENERVRAIRQALARGDIGTCLERIRESGLSSWTLLQNCIPEGAIENQAVSYALAYLKTICPDGIFRIHGGGFAGTVQGFIPVKSFAAIQDNVETHFGRGKMTPLVIRSRGVIHI